MLLFILALALAAAALLGVVLQKTYAVVPLHERKRQAAAGNVRTATLYRAQAYGASLPALLWIFIGLTAAGSFLLLARLAPTPLGFIAILLLLWIAFTWVPDTRLTRLSQRLTVWCTPAVVWLLIKLDGPLRKLVALAHLKWLQPPHTGAYQREDLIELLHRQEHQPDNRVPVEELEIARRVLGFSDQKVRDSLVPRSKVRSVSPDDTISPILVDELHEAGHPRLPVYDKKAKRVVGVLWVARVAQLASIKRGGAVSDYMDDHVVYVHESDSLDQVLEAYYKTKQQLFVVVNSFEEYVGIITLDDVLMQLVGIRISDELTQHDDLQAVAKRHLAPAKAVEPEPAPEASDENELPPSDETVVE